MALRTRGRRGVLWWARLTAALALAVGFCALADGPASAATVRLVASEPRSEQTVDNAPGWVTIAFNAAIDSSIAKVIVEGPDGDNVTTGSLIVEGTNVTSQLRDRLPQGTYTVHYRVNGSDGDIEGGAFQFAYGTGSFSSPPDKRWSGSEKEPAILKGIDPNDSEPPKNAPTTTPPDVEVEKSDGTKETVDPGPTQTSTASGGVAEDQPATEDSSTEPAEPTATADAPTSTSGPASRLPLIVGGAVLLIALGAGAVAVGLRVRRGGSADS